MALPMTSPTCAPDSTWAKATAATAIGSTTEYSSFMSRHQVR